MTTRTLDRPATYDDLRGLPPEARAEIFDGVIVMSPGASPQHNRAARYLANALEVAGQPHGYLVNTDNDVQWHPTAVTRPDVCVVAEAHANDQPITHYPPPVRLGTWSGSGRTARRLGCRSTGWSTWPNGSSSGTTSSIATRTTPSTPSTRATQSRSTHRSRSLSTLV